MMSSHHPDDVKSRFAGVRCLVTGGAGFIGSNLSRALVAAGATVTVLDDLSTGSLDNLADVHVRVVRGGVADSPQLRELVRESDYVFHMAAQVGNVKSIEFPVSDAQSNIIGTVRLLDAARGSAVKRIVYSSSSAIFGEAERLPIDESHPQRPASFYALSKQTGEKYALLAASLWNVPAVCLRYFNVYGYPSEESDYSGVISIFFRRLGEGQPLLIYGDGQQSRDFVYVLDVVHALMRAAIAGTTGEVYNIGTGKASTIDDVAAGVMAATGKTAPIEKRESRAGEVRHSVADISKARRELGYEPQYDLRTGLREYWTRVQQRPAPSAAATVASGDRILVLVQNADDRDMLARFRFDAFNFQPVIADSPADYGAFRELLREQKPVACLSLSSGTASGLLALASESERVPMFSVVSSTAELDAIPIADADLPRTFFLAARDVVVRALSDARYGRTLLPSGHPRDEGAADRMLRAIRSFGTQVDDRPQLSIVVPAYKESSNLDIVCDRLLGVFDRDNVSAEILLIDDASPDDTYEAAVRQMWKSPRVRAFTKPTPRGMGNAIQYGIERARAPIVGITMGDGSDQVERIPEMYRKVADEGYALVIGSRYRAKENYEAVPRLYRFWSRCFRLTAWAVVGIRLSDYTNAFRVFDRRIFARYGPESGGFEISPEITFKAWFATRRVSELDVRHLKRASGQSKFSFLRAGPGYGKILLKAFVNRLTGRWFTLDW
jgi:UDP-glucose 4-epimerase